MKLYPYQEIGVEFLAARRRAYLADDMGLGKTIMAASAARRVAARRTLIICPASARDNWRAEWDTWGPTTGEATIMSWSSPRLLGELSATWDLVIFDEAHFGKNPKAKRTRALMAAQDATRLWCLSGTPTPNKNFAELFTVFQALQPHVLTELGLPTYDNWFDHFCLWSPTTYGRRVYGIQNTDDLRPYLDNFLLRRRLADVDLELPPLRVDLHRLPKDGAFLADPAMADAYQRMEAEAATDDASTSRLRRYLGEYKSPRIAAILTGELIERQYGKIVVMAYHRDVLTKLREHLSPFGVTGFDGSTPVDKRQDIIDAFRSSTARVFVVQQTAGGTAIDGLQVANEIVLVEPGFVPDPIRQQIKRIHRIGSTRPCRARIFAVSGTLDEAILGTIARKLRNEKETGI